MKRNLSCRALVCLPLALALALFSWGEARGESLVSAEVDFQAGYRQDQLDWTIGKVVSELTWDDLDIYEVKASGRFEFGNEYRPEMTTLLKGTIGYGWIEDGENQDSDYSGAGRSGEWSRSNNDADDDDVFDASIGIGPRFSLGEGRVRLTPLIGLSYHEQNLTITEGFQTLSEPSLAPPGFMPPDVGPIEGLDSTYEAQWETFWVGLDVDFDLAPSLVLSASAEYHWADYDAEANWNLREDLADPSFEHEADGTGVVLSAAIRWNLDGRWSLDLIGGYQDWETDPGTDTTFFSDGSSSRGRLGEVGWESSSVRLGLTYRFF